MADETRQSRRQWARITAKLSVAAVVMAGTGLAVSTLQNRAGAGIVADIADPMPVAALPLRRASGYGESRRYAGRLEPARETVLGFERAGKVVEVMAGEGDAVTAGEVIARLDTRLLRNARDRLIAVREAQEASVELARLTDERQAGLTDRAVSAQRRDETRLQLSEARARLAETDAALDGIAIDLEKSVLRAPYAGHVAARLVDEGAVVDAGGPVLELLETSAPRARIGLAPDAAAGLEIGGRYSIDYRGLSHPARLIALRPDIDPASRTVEALFALDAAAGLAFGDLVGFEARQWHDAPGYWVPLTALVEDDHGLWSVYAIAEGPGAPRVRSAAVRVLSVEGERAFVAADLPDGASVVRDGTHRVIPGQSIRVAGLAE
jgi:RND family efflux transporter MFP subunit